MYGSVRGPSGSSWNCRVLGIREGKRYDPKLSKQAKNIIRKMILSEQAKKRSDLGSRAVFLFVCLFVFPGVMMSNIGDRRKIMSEFYLGGYEHQCRCINKKLQRLEAEMLQTRVTSPIAFLIYLSPRFRIRIHLLCPYQLQSFGEKKNVWVCRRRVSAPLMESASGPFSKQ